MNSTWWLATGSPKVLKMMKRVDVVPWSMLPTNQRLFASLPVWLTPRGSWSMCILCDESGLGGAEGCAHVTEVRWTWTNRGLWLPETVISEACARC